VNRPGPGVRRNPGLGTVFWGAAAVTWTACVLGMAVSPLSRMAWAMESMSDKTLHGAAFAVGAILWIRTLRDRARRPLSPLLGGAMIAFSVGLLIEFLQRYVPGRTPEAGDLVANAVGVAIGALFMAPLILRRSSQPSAAPPDDL